jgi:hypothetical protein
MAPYWKTITLTSEAEVLDKLLELRGKQWLSRGHSEPHGALVPSIDRGDLANLSRQDKLERERASIDLFRATARFFASEGEQGALKDDFVALCVLRHYAVPTRLLDWSISPYVAAYFAVHDHDPKDGELWSFGRVHYEEIGKQQWKRWPETTTEGRGDDSKFAAGLTAFMADEPPDWVVAVFYPSGFPRQDAQSGAYTMTARFGRDHAEALKNLLKDDSKHRRYLIPAKLKPTMRRILLQDHGVWRGALFPDSAGAAETAASAFPGGL